MVDVLQCELKESNGDRLAVSWINKHLAFEGAVIVLPALGFFPLLSGFFRVTKVYQSPCLPLEWFQTKKKKPE